MMDTEVVLFEKNPLHCIFNWQNKSLCPFYKLEMAPFISLSLAEPMIGRTLIPEVLRHLLSCSELVPFSSTRKIFLGQN